MSKENQYKVGTPLWIYVRSPKEKTVEVRESASYLFIYYVTAMVSITVIKSLIRQAFKVFLHEYNMLMANALPNQFSGSSRKKTTFESSMSLILSANIQYYLGEYLLLDITRTCQGLEIGSAMLF